MRPTLLVPLICLTLAGCGNDRGPEIRKALAQCVLQTNEEVLAYLAIMKPCMQAKGYALDPDAPAANGKKCGETDGTDATCYRPDD